MESYLKSKNIEHLRWWAQVIAGPFVSSVAALSHEGYRANEPPPDTSYATFCRFATVFFAIHRQFTVNSRRRKKSSATVFVVFLAAPRGAGYPQQHAQRQIQTSR
jgi:hypothetical protein